MAAQQIGPNATAEVQGRELVIRVDLGGPVMPSASGKTALATKTPGARVTDGAGTVWTVGLNVYRSK